MLIIGCDFHSRFQQIAMVDTETGEYRERRLEHGDGEARRFYATLPEPAPCSVGPFSWASAAARPPSAEASRA